MLGLGKVMNKIFDLKIKRLCDKMDNDFGFDFLIYTTANSVYSLKEFPDSVNLLILQ